MKHILLGGVSAIAIGLAGSAFAADMPLKAAPVGKSPVFNWSGWYIGGHLGAGNMKVFSDSTNVTAKNTNIVGGMQLSYLMQSGSIVYGAEGDISAAGMSKQNSNNVYQVNMLASVRGKLGFAFDRILLFGTAGVGWVGAKDFSSDLGTSRKTVTRAVYGAGIQYAYNQNLILRVEGLDYVGSKNIAGGGDDVTKLKDVWVVRIGADYKFDSSGWGKRPVSLK